MRTLAVNLWQWLASKISSGETKSINDPELCCIDPLFAEIYVRELAFWSCVNIISNSISKCEFKTFQGNKEVQDQEYYLWNIEPNKNQSSSAFIHKWISQLYLNNEALIVANRNGNQLFVADSFQVTQNTMLGDTFTDVSVDEYTFPYSFKQEDVIYLQLSSQDMRTITNGIYTMYQKLITSGMSGFQDSRGKKVIFNYDTIPTATPDREAFDELINNRLKTFLSAQNAALPLGKGQKLDDFGSRYSGYQETSRDIRSMIDDVSDFTAKALLVPPSLVRGDVQDTSNAVDQLLTFCIDPLTDHLSEEINRKRNGYDGFKRGNKIVIDTKTIKHVDLFGMAPNIDKLISSGCKSVNDILRAMGDQPINEPWADQHFMTKNYETVQQALLKMNGETTLNE